MLRCLVIALSGLGSSPLWADQTPLTSFAEVRGLPREAADQGLPVEVEGTVLFFARNPNNRKSEEGMVVYDGTAGCSVVSKGGPFPGREKLTPGARVRIAGRTNVEESFYPNVVEAEVEYLGPGTMPEPRVLPSKDWFAARYDSEWVMIEAVVVGRSPSLRTWGAELVLQVDGHVINARVAGPANIEAEVEEIMQRRVTVQAVLATEKNSQGQMTGRHLFVPSIDFIVPIIDKPTQEVARTRKIGKLLTGNHGFRSEVRIEGVITQSRPDGFYLRDDSGSAFVWAGENFDCQVGDEVSVEGYATVARFRPEFRAYRIEKLGVGEVPDPVPFDPGEGIRVELHGERVLVEAELLSVKDMLDETRLQCQVGDQVFVASLPGPNLYARELDAGDQLRLTGVCEATSSQLIQSGHRADGFRLILASDSDIEVLKKAPWWTVERLLVALGCVVAALLGVVLWNWILRKRVEAQAKVIVEQAEQGIVKDERQRIARDLHDTVEQELTGISMQLGNLSSAISEEDAVAGKRLALARDMLKHCREETRASIADLRDPHLHERDLPDAMRESLGEVARLGGVEFAYELTGAPKVLQATTEQHLLRMGREAVANAVEHSEAERIDVGLCYDDEGLTLTVSDNGRGFDAEQRPPAGHFGLTGMRERANKIHASISIDSHNDVGTTIRVVLPWTSPAALADRLS